MNVLYMFAFHIGNVPSKVSSVWHHSTKDLFSPCLMKLSRIAFHIKQCNIVALAACFFALLSGCASGPDLRPLHVASDAAATAITGLYQATERTIEREVRARWAVCDKLSDIDSRIECRKTAVTVQFESTLALRKKLDQATNAHRVLAAALETAEACKIARDVQCQAKAIDSALAVYPDVKKLILELSK